MSVSLSASAPLVGFASVRFWRSRRLGSGAVFVLSGVPAACAGAWGFRLFVLGCSLVELGQQASGRVWFAFRCPAAVAGLLASRFPVPAGLVPLVVSASVRVLPPVPVPLPALPPARPVWLRS